MTRAELEAEIAELEARLDNLREELDQLPEEPVKYRRPPRKGTMARMLWDSAHGLNAAHEQDMIRRAENLRNILKAAKDGKPFRIITKHQFKGGGK